MESCKNWVPLFVFNSKQSCYLTNKTYIFHIFLNNLVFINKSTDCEIRSNDEVNVFRLWSNTPNIAKVNPAKIKRTLRKGVTLINILNFLFIKCIPPLYLKIDKFHPSQQSLKMIQNPFVLMQTILYVSNKTR